MGADDRAIEDDRAGRIGETVEIEVERYGAVGHRERRAGGQLEHRRNLPAAERPADGVLPRREERQQITAVQGEAMGRVEARSSLGEPLVGSVLIRVV